MTFTAIQIKKLIEENLAHAEAEVYTEDNVHFQAQVICPAFATKTRVQQQQMVMQILQSYIRSGEIHALALKTYPSPPSPE